MSDGFDLEPRPDMGEGGGFWDARPRSRSGVRFRFLLWCLALAGGAVLLIGGLT